jgi:glycosyltransferase involved in cell wall biosynthesis
VRILHAIHDFLPRHRAGSEIYAFELCRELARTHHVSLLSADYDLERPHGRVTWRVFGGLPVIEIVNNWRCTSFEETYRPALIGERIRQALQAVQPEVVHIHNLLNLSFDLPAIARAQGIPVVATLHDYALVCPSGGQRIHRAEALVCRDIDTERCARCFRQSPFQAHASLTKVAEVTQLARPLRRLSRWTSRRLPWLDSALKRFLKRVPAFEATPKHIDDRLAAARRLFREVDLFVAPSAALAGEFERLGLDHSRIRVSDYGFVPLPLVPRRAPARPLRLGFVGTLVWHKGIHVLLEAVAGLRADAYELKLFGNVDVFPDYVSDLRRRATGLPVRFMGAFDRDRTAAVYAEIDVLVVPSLWLENSPLVIHEAFMTGVAVVAARIGGIPDLVDDGRNGMLYEPSSAPELTARLQELIDHPERIQALTAAAPQVKSVADDAREWDRVYVEALARHRTAALGV